MEDYIWVKDPSTGQESQVSYDELDADIYPQLFKPIGGFCYPAGNFIRLDLPKVPYYVQSWLPKQGRALIYGTPKSGKSFLTYHLGSCIAEGLPFLGIPTSVGKVLILQFELGEEVFQGRIRTTGKPYENVYLGTSFAMKLDTQAGQDQFERAITAIEPDVVILDPLYKLFKGDENDTQDFIRVTDFLDKMIAENKLSLVVMHHTGKDLSKGARGSSVLEGWVDSSIELKRTTLIREPLEIRLTPKLLRHAEITDEPIEAKLTKNCTFETTPPKLSIRGLVEDYFETHPKQTITIAELVDAGLGSRKAISNARQELSEEGVVMQVGYGKYRLSGGVGDCMADNIIYDVE